MNYKFYLALFLLVVGLGVTIYFIADSHKLKGDSIPQETQIQYMQLAKAYGERSLETCKEKGCGEIVENSKPEGALYGIKIISYKELDN